MKDSNKIIDDIMYRAGLTAQGCWDQMDEYDKAAITTFGQLIVEDIVARLEDSGDHAYKTGDVETWASLSALALEIMNEYDA